jgi:aldehyde:ferredoxin oxidoreductase
MHGWTGTLLTIDLTAKKTGRLHPEAGLYHRWIGGRGLAGHFLRPAATLAWDHPDMPLLLFTGPLVATLSPTSGRMCIISRSPLTGTVGDCSVGGGLATHLKRAGLDGIIITGQSPAPCGLCIVDGDVTFHPASDLLGKTVPELARRVPGDGSLLATGPAADNGVRYANLMVDGHFAAGRNGLGCVFGAKNLKYIRVLGSGKTAVRDPQGLRQACEDVNRLIAASPVLSGELGISRFGTGALYDLMDNRAMMPTANFRSTRFSHAGSMNAFHYKKRYDPADSGCRGCRIRCKKVAAGKVAMPEFETMSHFSALLQNRDIESVVAANALCNAMGMDTISAAATLACYAEIRQRRLEPSEILELLARIAAGSGKTGRELGLGSARLAQKAGCPEVSISVKGQELPAYDPRGAYGMALAYALSTRGACHLRAYPISHEILRKPVATDRFSFEGKARIIKIAEDVNAVVDSLTACKFVFFGASLEEYAPVYTAVTGVPVTGQDLIAAGERMVYNERIMNAENGFDADDDDLPQRFFTEPGSSGNGITVAPIDRAAFLAARQRYYRIRGLDTGGRPTPETAARLELPWNP